MNALRAVLARLRPVEDGPRAFPYDRPAGYVVWPTGDTFADADAIVAADRSLAMLVDHPDTW